MIDGTVIRYADQIAEFVPESKEHPNGINILFQQHIRKDGVREYWTGRPSEALQEKIYNERDRELSEKEWPLIPKDNQVRELIYHDLAKKKK